MRRRSLTDQVVDVPEAFRVNAADRIIHADLSGEHVYLSPGGLSEVLRVEKKDGSVEIEVRVSNCWQSGSRGERHETPRKNWQYQVEKRTRPGLPGQPFYAWNFARVSRMPVVGSPTRSHNPLCTCQG